MVATQILVVIIAAIALTIVAEKRRIQAPLLLALVGVLMSFVPGMQRLELGPETILGVVVPPLLYSAALDFSFFSFMRSIGFILNLGVALVVATAVAGAFAMAWVLPDLSLAAAFILGAVVAPPDAVSALSVGRQLGLPKRLMTLLKGESLINDAAALAIFSIAVALATRQSHFIESPALYFLYAAGAGSVLGIAIGLAVHRLRQRLPNPTLATALALVVPFAAYAVAEELHASGIMAVVFAGFTVGHRSAELGFAGRIQEREVWRVVDTLLEAFVFAYMGLQLRFVIEDALASGFDPGVLGLAVAVLLAVVIGVRLAWVFAMGVLARARHRLRRRRARRADKAEPPAPLNWRESLVLGWAGMRGVVTVAAAAGTPYLGGSSHAVGGRDIIVPLAFCVALGTLLLQGMTLPWLIGRLRVQDNSEDDEAFRRTQREHARQVMREATLATVAAFRSQQTAEADIRFAETVLLRAQRLAEPQAPPEQPGTAQRRSPAQAQRLLAIAQSILANQRHALIAERNALKLDDEVLREVLESIDMEQAVIARRAEDGQALAD